jgi:hypothetical protein
MQEYKHLKSGSYHAKRKAQERVDSVAIVLGSAVFVFISFYMIGL